MRPRSIFRIAPIALAALLLACRATPAPQRYDEATSIIYVVKRSWHIDIGFAVEDLQQPLASLRAAFPTARFLEFGFGDRHYLMARDHGPPTLLAALWPGPGLVLMTALTATPQAAFGASNVEQLRLTPAQAKHIQAYIWRTLSMPGSGDDMPPEPVAAGPYGGSVFYAAIPRYSAFRTCNTWAAEALKSAPLPIRSTGVEFSGQVWSQVKRIASP